MIAESQKTLNDLILRLLKSNREETIYIRNITTFRMQISRARKIFRNKILTYSFVKVGTKEINGISYIEGIVKFDLLDPDKDRKSHWEKFKDKATKIDSSGEESQQTSSEVLISNLFRGG